MAVLILLTLALAQAEPRQSTERHRASNCWPEPGLAYFDRIAAECDSKALT